MVGRRGKAWPQRGEEEQGRGRVREEELGCGGRKISGAARKPEAARAPEG